MKDNTVAMCCKVHFSNVDFMTWSMIKSRDGHGLVT